MIRNVIELHS